MDDLKSKLNSASGPKTQATTPDYVKFHDDKVLYPFTAHHQQIFIHLALASCCRNPYIVFLFLQSTYTGVYANGGPTNVDGKGDLSELCDRSDANVRGVTEKFANSH